MPTSRLLIVAGPQDAGLLRAAVLAAGAVPIGAGAGGVDLARVVEATRPTAAVLAGGGALGDPEAAVRRLRAVGGGGIPTVFLGTAAEVQAVEALVDAVFVRPASAVQVVSRAVALTLPAESEGGRSGRGGGSDRPRTLADVGAGIGPALADALATAAGIAASAPAPAAVAAPAGTPLTRLWLDLLAPAGPPPRDPSPPLEGELTDVDLPMLLGRLHRAGTTGRVVVRGQGQEKAIFVEAGRPVAATSSDPRDRMIEMLLRDGDITPEQRHTAVAAAAESPRRMGALLIELGVMDAGALLGLVRRHHEAVIASMLPWTEGRWHLEPGALAPPGQAWLLRHPAAVVRRGLRAGHPAERLWARLGAAENVFALDRRPSAAELIREIAVDEADRATCLLFDGVRSVREVVRASGLGETEVAQLAFTLWAFGALAPAAAHAQGWPPARPADRRDARLERERIAARHALAVQGDYFEVLGIARDASAEEVARAYRRARGAFSPETVGPVLAGELAAELATIAEVLEEALRVLGTESLRVRYQSHLRAEPRAAARPPGPYPALVVKG